MEWPKITLFGDSITRRSSDVENGCWSSMLTHQVANFFQVDVYGFDGYSTKWSVDLMPKLFPKSYLDKVEIFIPFFGHNDSWNQPFPGHVPVDQYEANVRTMLKYLNDNGVEDRKIIMITPTWYHAESFLVWLKSSGFPPFGKDFNEAKKYSEVILKIANEKKIDVIDFFDKSSKHEPLEELFYDGVHYSRVGAKLFFDCLMPIVEKKIEAAFKKPLADLWHVMPFDQRPEVKEVIMLAMAAQAKAQEPQEEAWIFMIKKNKYYDVLNTG